MSSSQYMSSFICYYVKVILSWIDYAVIYFYQWISLLNRGFYRLYPISKIIFIFRVKNHWRFWRNTSPRSSWHRAFEVRIFGGWKWRFRHAEVPRNKGLRNWRCEVLLGKIGQYRFFGLVDILFLGFAPRKYIKRIIKE